MNLRPIVVRFWGHKRQNCDCHDVHCMTCEGALYSCAVCHGAEGALPTHCPGVPMSMEQMDSVYNEKLDFDGRRGWVAEPAVHWRRRV